MGGYRFEENPTRVMSTVDFSPIFLDFLTSLHEPVVPFLFETITPLDD
jgi:hypothetical protein